MIVYRGGLGTLHVTTEEIAAYIDRGVDRRTGARLEAHFEGCAVCREELAESCALLGVPLPPRRRKLGPQHHALVATTAGLAATLLLLLLLP